jgi:hypothetical protein
MASAKLMGMIVDRQAVLHGNAADFQSAADEAQIVAELSEKVGSRKAMRFLELVRELEAEDDVIEGDVGNGEEE